MLITHRTQTPVDIVDLSGTLVMGDACTKAKKKLLEVVETGQAKVVLNLAKVTFMDSTGLSVLISALKAARSKDGNVALLNLTSPVQSLIELTRLQQVFGIFQDEAAAIISVK
ncbi:MAG: STAS domain-containing protein [Pseudomonadota bacterium]